MPCKKKHNKCMSLKGFLVILLILCSLIAFGLKVGDQSGSKPCGQYKTQEAQDFCAENLP